MRISCDLRMPHAHVRIHTHTHTYTHTHTLSSLPSQRPLLILAFPHPQLLPPSSIFISDPTHPSPSFSQRCSSLLDLLLLCVLAPFLSAIFFSVFSPTRHLLSVLILSFTLIFCLSSLHYLLAQPDDSSYATLP